MSCPNGNARGFQRARPEVPAGKRLLSGIHIGWPIMARLLPVDCGGSAPVAVARHFEWNSWRGRSRRWIKDVEAAIGHLLSRRMSIVARGARTASRRRWADVRPLDFLSNDSSRVQVVVTRAFGERVHVDMTDRVAGKDVGATSGKERAEEQLIASGCGGSNQDGLPKSRGS